LMREKNPLSAGATASPRAAAIWRRASTTSG
jgi:hypothetical protein